MKESDENPIYDFAPDVAPPPPPRPPQPTLDYRARKDDRPAPSEPETIKNVRAPMWLLGGGIVVKVAFAMFTRRNALGAAFLDECADIAVGTALMLAGILLAAKLRGLALGPFWTTVFKLAAISVAPSAVLDLVWPIFRIVPIVGPIAAWIGEFALYFALLGVLFDLEESDTWYCVCIIFLVNLAVYFFLLWAKI